MIAKQNGRGGVTRSTFEEKPLSNDRWKVWLGISVAVFGLAILTITFGLVPVYGPPTSRQLSPPVPPQRKSQPVPSTPTPRSSAKRGPDISEALTRLGTVSTYESEPAPMSASVSQSDFSKALWRLSRALDRFPQSKPQEIIQRVNGKNSAQSSVCPFDWNSGEPALLLNGVDGINVGLATILNHCASAIERL